MPFKTSDVILSPARILYAPVGTAAPPDTLAAGAAWPVAWVEVGFTSAPLTVGYEFDTAEADLQNILGVVKRAKTSENVTLETTMAESSVANMALAFDGAVQTIAAGTSQPAAEVWSIGGQVTLTERTWAAEGYYTADNGSTYPIRVFVWRGSSTGGGELEFSKDDFMGIPLSIGAMVDMTKPVGQRLIQIRRITGPTNP